MSHRSDLIQGYHIDRLGQLYLLIVLCDVQRSLLIIVYQLS